MNIYGHVIKSSEIVGIGPLMKQDKMEGGFSSTIVSFDVYLRSSTINIATNRFTMLDAAEDRKKGFADFKDVYLKAFQEISELIGEPKYEQAKGQNRATAT